MRTILAIITVIILLGCDPMRRINMKNNTGDIAEITWFIKEDSILSSPFFISNSQEVVFELKPERQRNLVKMSFGIGTWSEKEIVNLVDDLDSVVIKWNDKTAVLLPENQLKDYLMARRTGIDKSKINIVLRESDQ